MRFKHSRSAATAGMIAFLIAAPLAAAAEETFTVAVGEVEDLKAVYATVQAADVIAARARISGTVTTLSVDEGSAVAGGAVIAVVGDPKIALKIEALDARIKAARSEVENARTERNRQAQLFAKGTIAKARLDQVETALEVAENQLKAAEAERSVVSQQGNEGEVLAPGPGRVLSVPVTEGSVVMPGETIATIAADKYILRLDLPERHARFIKIGDPVIVGKRGLSRAEGEGSEGKIIQVYPELQNGRVVADAEVSALGDYFVGERALVWIAAGRRTATMIPVGFTFKRFGIDYVRIAAEGGAVDVVVQLGQPASVEGGAGVEVLSGLRAGDVLVKPE